VLAGEVSGGLVGRGAVRLMELSERAEGLWERATGVSVAMTSGSGICATASEGLILPDGGLNDCYVDVILQGAVAALALLGVVIGFATLRAAPRTACASLPVDRLRAALLALRFLVLQAELVLGATASSGIAPSDSVCAACRSAAVVLVAFWQRQELKRGLAEASALKLWWLLALVAQVPVVIAASAPGRGTVLALSLVELLLCTASVGAYCVSSGRRGGARDAPLLQEDEEGGLSMVDGHLPLARQMSARPPSPEETMGLMGWLCFAWFTPIVDLAFARDKEQGKLEPSDVYPLSEKNSARRQLERLDHEWQVELRKPKPSLLAAMTRCFWFEVLATAWIKVLNDGLHFVGPFLLNKIIVFVGSKSGGNMGYVYAIGIVVSSATQAVLMAHYFQGGYQTGMRVRSSLILMSYQKALKVLPWPTPAPAAPAALPEPQGQGNCSRFCKRTAQPPKPRAVVGGMGQMTNLISADTDKFSFLMPYFNLIWSAPLQVILCFVMLFGYVRWSLFAGVLVMIGFTALSGVVQNKARKVQAEAMKAKDERLKIEVELLKIVKIIKFYAWELTIESKVKELRDKELALQLKYKLWSVLMFLSFSLSPTLVALGTFTFYTVVMGNKLDSATAFTALSLFNILSFPLGAMPMMTRWFMEAAVAKDRLEAFFLAPEVAPRPQPLPGSSAFAVQLQVSKLRWPDHTELLGEVNFQAKKGELVVVVGKTGAGKSGLLYALLGELPIDEADGEVHLDGSVGYCAQSAWIRNATLRDNITNDSSTAADDHYEAVLDACALRADIEVLPQGDKTLIGDRGINLSGGQKQRVALARAVYANPDIYVLDDVLSALDSHVASHICTNLFKGPLFAGKTVVLVTHSQKAIPLASHIVTLSDKKVVFSGSYKDFSGNKGLAGNVLAEDEPAPGAVEPGSPEPDTQADTKKAENAKEATKSESNNAKDTKAAAGGANKGMAAATEERRSGAVTMKVYGAYAKACGGVLPVGFFLLTVVISEGSRNLSDGWLAAWSNKGGGADGLVLYAWAALLCLFSGLLYSVTRVFVGQRGSRILHEQCVNALLRAQMTFFDLTPSGQILNRLAEDTNILDYNLPQTMAANFIWFWRSASIVVVCMIVSPYLFLLVVPMFVLYAKLAKRYLPATRDLRRLDAAARSPIFSHFSETMAGVSTIRAMQQQARAVNTNILRLETQMEAYYLTNTAARWLSLRLQFNGTVLVGAVSTLGIYLATQNKVEAGLIGLAITYALRLTDTLNQVNRESADRETQMVSVERVYAYVTGVAPEAPLRIVGTSQQLPRSWPSRGAIKVDNVTMRYREGLPTVLNGITLDIKAGERIGIVGRTGCGKSSFLSTLLRLVELQSGAISVDDWDLAVLGLHDLREKVAIIPQDPAILTGTVRFNLDPFSVKSDEELWTVLEKSQLKSRVESAGGLDSKVEEGGGNYSVGELQLMCLARALLRRQATGGLLLLDEATSALDADTDAIIQEVIRSDFSCTTITIAHRIQTLLDYDRVAVFDAGRVVEFDSPEVLLKRETSAFRALAREGGVSADYCPAAKS